VSPTLWVEDRITLEIKLSARITLNKIDQEVNAKRPKS